MATMASSKTARPGRLWAGQVLFVVLAILAVPAAQAASKDAKERTAKTACLSGDYAKGVALLAELYVSTGQAIYLFNQGRCFEQNGKYQEAIIRFREFQLKNSDAGKAPDESAEKHIATCQALLDKQKPLAPVPASSPIAIPAPVPAPVPALAAPPNAEPATPPMAEPATPVSPPVVQPEPEPKAVEPPPEIAASPKPAEPARGGPGLRMAGIVTAAVGLGGIASGVILNVKANHLTKDLEAANDSRTTLYSRDKESARSRYQTWAWVAYGTGAACVAGGAVLYFLGHRAADTQVALVPTVAQGNVGASLQGAF